MFKYKYNTIRTTNKSSNIQYYNNKISGFEASRRSK
jgi:hypothetical protein